MSEPRTIQVAFRLPVDIVEMLDHYSELMGEEFNMRVSRTSAVERLVTIALAIEQQRLGKLAGKRTEREMMAYFGFTDGSEFFQWMRAATTIIEKEGIDASSVNFWDRMKEFATPEKRKELLATVTP